MQIQAGRCINIYGVVSQQLKLHPAGSEDG